MIESPLHDPLPVLKKDASVKLVDIKPLGNQYMFRFNTLHKPFDNAKIRQAVFYALNQEDFLKAVIGDPAYYKGCKSFYPCGSLLETTKGMEDLLASNFARARQLLQEAGYDGTPIVLMHSPRLRQRQ
jgi:peptide/nickel transport system substrate-binding protein